MPAANQSLWIKVSDIIYIHIYGALVDRAIALIISDF